MNHLGKYKVWMNRIQTYTGPLNFIMILYLYIINEPLGVVWWIWVMVLVVVLVSVLSVDMLFVFPGELSYTTLKNPEMMKIKENTERILEVLEEHR